MLAVARKLTKVPLPGKLSAIMWHGRVSGGLKAVLLGPSVEAKLALHNLSISLGAYTGSTLKESKLEMLLGLKRLGDYSQVPQPRKKQATTVPSHRCRDWKKKIRTSAQPSLSVDPRG